MCHDSLTAMQCSALQTGDVAGTNEPEQRLGDREERDYVVTKRGMKCVMSSGRARAATASKIDARGLNDIQVARAARTNRTASRVGE